MWKAKNVVKNNKRMYRELRISRNLQNEIEANRIILEKSFISDENYEDMLAKSEKVDKLIEKFLDIRDRKMQRAV